VDFTFDPTDEAFREEIRTWVRANLPADLAEKSRKQFHLSWHEISRWVALLNADGKGWGVPNWSVELGGPGWSLMQQYIFEEVLIEEDAPSIDVGGAKMIGPIINNFGSADQRERFIKPWMEGKQRYAQGFSEPNAGSDLAALTTTARRVPSVSGDGDDYIINGRKIWTSGGHYSDWIYCLVKTDMAAKQRGISLIMVPLKVPGVTIRPIIDIAEEHNLNEVFFDDVRTSAANLIGEENKGWTYAKSLLESERALSGEAPRNRRYLQILKKIARDRTRCGVPLIEDHAFGARIAQLESDLNSLEWMTLRALTAKAGGDFALPLGSILKVRGSELLQKITELHIEALGDHGHYVHHADDSSGTVPGPDYAPGLLNDFMYRRATTIYGGSNEIQRTIIARQFLGL
jgi:alkylation response protein AidB-like acyl-CoA dehydrogenase